MGEKDVFMRKLFYIFIMHVKKKVEMSKNKVDIVKIKVDLLRDGAYDCLNRMPSAVVCSAVQY